MLIDVDNLKLMLYSLPADKKTYGGVLQMIDEVAAMEAYEDWFTEVALVDEKREELSRRMSKIPKNDFFFREYIKEKRK